MVFGNDSPVVRQQLDKAFAGVNHRFNGKRHSGFKHQTCARYTVMQNLRIFMEVSADAMAAIFLYNREAPGFGIGLYSMAYIGLPTQNILLVSP